MASSNDASNRNLRSVRSLRRDRTPLKVRLRWGLLAGGLALAGLSCGDLDPTAESTGLNASLSSKPGRVDDLRVLDVSDTSVTLVWTEVGDGLGSAPDYQVRYAASPIGWGWGSATVVSSGTCASPIDGVAVDSILECTVEGLDAESMYDFQLVAFRGTLNEDAVFGDLSNVATGTTEAPPGPPAQVTDLTVAAAEATSATLRFTQVDDGTGLPAKYEVRYAVSPIGYGWGSATVVTEGTCAAPIAGTAVDSALTCTVAGLEHETTYDFQLVSFRGERGVDAVYGDLSNVATGTTTAPESAGAPGRVTDLAVTGVSDTSATLQFTQVDDGAGQPASYDVRYAPSPIGYGWGSATVVTEGTCATPVAGTGIDSILVCTVAGLASSTVYDFQLVAFRGELGVDAVFGELSNVASGSTAAPPATEPPPPGSADCADAAPEWIWCDDFEEDRLASYFEYNDAGGSFTRAAGVGLDGSYGMRAHWAVGQVSAGALHLAFGRTPQAYFDPVDAGTADYRDIYWRMYVRNEPSWTGGGGDKLSRATIFASSTSWAQAMIAHVWSGRSTAENYLVIDPASGTDESGNLITTTYNDFDNLRWLGGVQGTTSVFDADHVGQWHCVEAHARLNDAGSSNGTFELWINGKLDAQRTGLNWVGAFDDYGINAVFFENYWNAGSPADQERYFDDLVVSTAPIGCGDAPAPSEPEPEPDVASLSVTPAADTMNAIGYGAQLTASAFDANGDPISSPSIAWSSLDPGIATVDANGYVISKATGTALIVATATCCATSADTAHIDVRQVVASVEVSPATASLALDDTLQLTATALDSAGVAVPGSSFAWSSSDLLVATVLATGPTTALASPVALGSATITASSDGTSAGVPITVKSTDTDTGTPNEPDGFTIVTERPFDAMSENGWLSWVSQFSIVPDATSPKSPGSVGQMFYPAGVSDYDPGSTDYNSSHGFKKLYVSFWLKLSPNFQGHPILSKILYIWTHGKPVVFMSLGGEGDAPLRSQMHTQDTPMGARNMYPNLADVTIHRDVWHHWEFILVSNTGDSSDGEVHWWIDGTKVGEYRDVLFGSSSQSKTWDLLQYHPIWGGQGGTVVEDMYMWMDHWYASGSP